MSYKRSREEGPAGHDQHRRPPYQQDNHSRGGFGGRGGGGFGGRGGGEYGGRGGGGFGGRGGGEYGGRGGGGFGGRGGGEYGGRGGGGFGGRGGGEYGGRGGGGYAPRSAEDVAGAASSGVSTAGHVKKQPNHLQQQQEGGRNVVVILEKAGLFLGRDGLVDAYDRAASTEIANASLEAVRPDIVHQCLLALFDTDLAYRRQLRVYISTIKGKTIEVSPTLRPPRTYGRFKGLMSALLRDGHISSVEGQTLMKVLPGTVAPVIPFGATVTGLCNSTQAPVKTASVLAKEARDTPVSNELQGGIKNVAGFYCISCTDDQNMDGIDYVTDSACVSVYPASSHVLCARICEGFGRWIGPVRRDADGGASTTAGAV